MAFQMVTSGSGWRLAASLITLGNEIKAAYPQATCLGTLGDVAHRAEGGKSDHNPVVQHGGLGIVRAIDIGGPDAMLKAIRQRVWALYAEQDPRLWMYGYSDGTNDTLINNFGLPFKTHVGGVDAGHLHVSVTQSVYPSVAGGYLSAIDSTAPWGIASVAPAGGGTVVTPPPPAPAVKAWQGYPVPALIRAGSGNYFGDIDGPAAEHGGINQAEKTLVKVLQQRLIACGFVPGITDVNSGWADGIFNMKDGHIGGPTSDAVTRFQQAHMPGTKFFGQVWSDDWSKLFNL